MPKMVPTSCVFGRAARNVRWTTRLGRMQVQRRTVSVGLVGALFRSLDPLGAGGATSGLGHAPPKGLFFVVFDLAAMLHADYAAGGHEVPRGREGRRAGLEAACAAGTTP